MKNDNYCGEHAYTTEIAANYEKDRRVERIWDDEQSCMKELVRAIPAGGSVLDVPVGTGRFFEYYKYRNLRVTGIDISEAMLGEAKKTADKFVMTDAVLNIGDARELDFPDSAFDSVVCWRLLHLLPLNVANEVIKELGRVSHERLIVQVYCLSRYAAVRAKLGKFKQDLLKLVLPAKTAYSDDYADSPWSHIASYYHSEADILGIFADHGLSVQHVRELGKYFATDVKVFILTKASA